MRLRARAFFCDYEALVRFLLPVSCDLVDIREGEVLLIDGFSAPLDRLKKRSNPNEHVAGP